MIQMGDDHRDEEEPAVPNVELLTRKIAKCDRLLKKKGKGHEDFLKLKKKRAEYVQTLGEIAYRAANYNPRPLGADGGSPKSVTTEQLSRPPPHNNFNDSLAVFEFSTTNFDFVEEEEQDAEEDGLVDETAENHNDDQKMKAKPEETKLESRSDAAKRASEILCSLPTDSKDNVKSPAVVAVVAQSKDIPQEESQKEQKNDNGSILSDSFSKNRAFNRPAIFDSPVSGGSQGRRSWKPKSKVQIEPANLEDDKDKDGLLAPADETRLASSKNRAFNRPAIFDSPMSGGSQGRRSWKPKSTVQIEPANLEDDTDKYGPSAPAHETHPASSKNRAVDPPATFDSPMSGGSQGRLSSKPKSKVQSELANLEDDKDKDVPSAPADQSRPASSSKNRAVNRPATFDSPMSGGSQGRRSSKPKSTVQIEPANLEDDKDKDGPPASSKNRTVDPAPATSDSPMSGRSQGRRSSKPKSKVQIEPANLEDDKDKHGPPASSNNQTVDPPATSDSPTSRVSQDRRSSKPKSKVQIEPANLEDDKDKDGSPASSKNRAVNRPATFDSPMSGGSQDRRSWKSKSKVQIEPANLEDDKDKDVPSAPIDETRPASSSKSRSVNRPATFDSPSEESQGGRSSKPKSKAQIEPANLEDDKDKDGPSAPADETRLDSSSKSRAVNRPADTFGLPMSGGGQGRRSSKPKSKVQIEPANLEDDKGNKLLDGYLTPASPGSIVLDMLNKHEKNQLEQNNKDQQDEHGKGAIIASPILQLGADAKQSLPNDDESSITEMEAFEESSQALKSEEKADPSASPGRCESDSVKNLRAMFDSPGRNNSEKPRRSWTPKKKSDVAEMIKPVDNDNNDETEQEQPANAVTEAKSETVIIDEDKTEQEPSSIDVSRKTEDEKRNVKHLPISQDDATSKEDGVSENSGEPSLIKENAIAEPPNNDQQESDPPLRSVTQKSVPEPQTADAITEQAAEELTTLFKEGTNKVIALFSTYPDSLFEHMPKQKRCLMILNALAIEPEFVDGSSPDDRSRRNALFALGGLRGVYPQLFVRNSNGDIRFFGDFERIELLNDCRTLVHEIESACL
jgi:hypothetical protein